MGLFCYCFGGVGIILSGPAYFIAHNKVKDATENPDDYEGSLKAMKTAKIIALITLIINASFFIYSLYALYRVDFDVMRLI